MTEVSELSHTVPQSRGLVMNPAWRSTYKSLLLGAPGARGGLRSVLVLILALAAISAGCAIGPKQEDPTAGMAGDDRGGGGKSGSDDEGTTGASQDASVPTSYADGGSGPILTLPDDSDAGDTYDGEIGDGGDTANGPDGAEDSASSGGDSCKEAGTSAAEGGTSVRGGDASAPDDPLNRCADRSRTNRFEP